MICEIVNCGFVTKRETFGLNYWCVCASTNTDTETQHKQTFTSLFGCELQWFKTLSVFVSSICLACFFWLHVYDKLFSCSVEKFTFIYTQQVYSCTLHQVLVPLLYASIITWTAFSAFALWSRHIYRRQCRDKYKTCSSRLVPRFISLLQDVHCMHVYMCFFRFILCNVLYWYNNVLFLIYL